MDRLDEKVNNCGFRCCDCPYDDCVVDYDLDEDPVTDDLVERLTSCKIYYQENKEKMKANQKRFYESHPEKHHEYYERRKNKKIAQRKHAYTVQARAQRRRRAITNYDYITSMDDYEMAEFLSRFMGKKDADIRKWLLRDLKEGNLNED